MTEAKHSPLEPCPFCQNQLTSKAGRINPYARCITPECFGTKMPVVNLDVQSDVIAWNTRAPTSLHAELVAALESTSLMLEDAQSGFISGSGSDEAWDETRTAMVLSNRAALQKAKQ